MALKQSIRAVFWSQCVIGLSIALSLTPGHADAKQKKANPSKSKVQVQLKQNRGAPGLRHIEKSSPSPTVGSFLEPERTESSNLPASYSGNVTIKHGCIGSSSSISRILRRLDVKDDQFADTFEAQAPRFLSSVNSDCLPYAIAIDSQRRVQALSIINDEKKHKDAKLVSFSRSETTGNYLVHTQDLSSGFSGYQEIELSLQDTVAYKANKAISAIPPELVWELSSLLKQIAPKGPDREKRFVRIIFNAGDKNTWAQIIGIEILDSTRTLVLADAFWVDRDDITGGFFTSEGQDLEQDSWINPLNYTRISRGVGTFASKGKRSQVVRKGNKKVVVTRFYSGYTGHQGIDYAAPIGTPIYAVANGKIIQYGPVTGGYGNLVIVEHPGNYKTYYAHLSAFNPELGVGSEVRRGLEIGYVGSTGRSTGPHLHFELRKNNVYQNPMSDQLELDLWNLRTEDYEKLTRQVVLFATNQKDR